MEAFALVESEAGPSRPARQDSSVFGFSREEFEFTTLLGEGAFARVLWARHRQDGREYAVKVVEKKMIQVQQRSNRVMTERLMLLKMAHPGIVRLHFAFQDDWSLYFGLELVQGGELATQIERMGTCSSGFTRFYTAEIIGILTYLRQCRVAHRDLKPENLLLTSEGHLKLVDFDAAMHVPDEGEGDAAGGRADCRGQFPPTESFVGTALYVAPEVISELAEPHQAFALDLWALGCIIYLMLVGKTPFHAESEYLVFQRIQAGAYSFPQNFRFKEARQLIEGLLSASPLQRPGLGREGLAELESHAFFSPDGYSEVCRQTPPPRLTRMVPRCRPGELEDLEYDAISSAECTPEVGQCFRSSSSMKVLLAKQQQQQHQAGDADVESDDEPEALFSWRSLNPKPEASQPSEQGLLAGLKCALPALHNSLQRQWLHGLLGQRVLMRGEDIRIGGQVVQRFLPCLRPRILVLTDVPRLLLLDHRGRKVIRDVDLAESGGGSAIRGDSMSACLNDKALNQKSRTDFEISLGRCRLHCRDTDLGAEAWLDELSLARQRVTMSLHQSVQSVRD